MSYPTTGKRDSGFPRSRITSKTDQLEEQGPIPSRILHAVNLADWDKETPGKAINAQPIKISLKPEVAYPNERQYPIKLEAKKRFATLHR